MAEKDDDAAELDEAEEVFGVILVPGDQTAKVLQPGEQEQVCAPVTRITVPRRPGLILALIC